MKSRTLKVAELATIIYAILVFMSLIVDNAYYSEFNIPIVSYMSGSEILLSCIERLASVNFSLWFYPIIMFVIGLSMVLCMQRLILLRTFIFQRRSLTAKFSTTVIYNTIIVLLLNIVFSANPIIYYKGSWDILLLTLIFFLDYIYYFMLPNPFASYWKASEPYNWKAYPIRRYLFERDKVRMRMAPDFYFGPKTRRLIETNYEYRVHLLVFAIIISLFSIEMRFQYRKADDVKLNGTGVCVILEGDGINIDTREGTIDYIGECAGNIFLYDRETQGTIIYDRSQIRHYKLITDYIAKANAKYDRYAEHVQSENRHVGTNLLERINAEAPLADVFAFTIPENFVLTQQENNYFVWEDTVTHTYIEQLNLPKRFFDHMPVATDIFNLDIYIAEETVHSDNMGLCSTTIKYFTGKGGEVIQTIIGDGDHYTAWLLYDPTGQHSAIRTDFRKSLRLKGNVWKQMAMIYRANKTLWVIVLIVLAIASFFCFIFGSVSYPLKKKPTKKKNKPEKKKSFSSIFFRVLTVILYLWVPVYFIITTTHRIPVILTFAGLALLTMLVFFLLGVLLSALASKPTT